MFFSVKFTVFVLKMYSQFVFSKNRSFIVFNGFSVLHPREEGSPTKRNMNKLIAGITGKPPPLTPDKKKDEEEDSMDFLDA